MTTILISGHRFSVPSPYASGHVCNAAEAEILNRKLHENLRTNFAKRIDELVLEGGCEIKVEQEFHDYSSSYHLGGPDPSDEEALAIARQIVRTQLKGQGHNLTDYSKASLTELAKVLLNGEAGGEIRVMAADRVRAIQKAAKDELRRIKKENGQ